MGGGWLQVDNLNTTAKTLALGAEAIEDGASDKPVIPDAGMSTTILGGSMNDLCRSVGKLAVGLAGAADAVQHHNTAFHVQDDGSATNFSNDDDSLDTTAGAH